MSTTQPLPRLLRTDPRDPATARALQRAFRAGRLHRLRKGVFVDSRAWKELGAVARHRLLALAVAPDLPPTAVFSHLTAAVLHGWPVPDDVPDRVHVADHATSGTLHRAERVLHGGVALESAPVWTSDGVRMTSAFDTALLVCATAPPEVAVVTVGHAVRTGGVDVDTLRAALPERPARGSVRARTVVDALHRRHESAGEDLTAYRLRELGFDRLVPQAEFRHDDGTIDRVDFWLPDARVVVEFDGRQKHEDEEMLDGRSPREVVWHEKIREDRLRAVPVVRTVLRVRWWHLVDPDRLRALFRMHRVPLPR